MCDAVRDLVVVCSSSRGGSSLFGELLRRSPDMLTWSAEINPHVTIPTLGSGGGCDVLADPTPHAGSGEGLATLQTELGLDLGQSARHVPVEVLSDHVAWRLTMQWPQEEVDPDRVAGWVSDTLAQNGWTGSFPAREEFLLALLPRVMAAHAEVTPHRYDVDPARARRRFPATRLPVGPPPTPVVEMAPFVLPRTWLPATATQAQRLTVVATTPRNAFRLPLLAKAFPNARVRVVHLTRNPAAAANGLRDGWRHHGFFSCTSDAPLDIAGYTDVFPEWGATWWNYDVPPGWQDWTDRSLPEVCAFQWRAAHQQTLERCAGMDVHRIAFEDVVGAPERRRHALTRLCDWLEVDPAPVLGDDHLPVVMSTNPPRARRWADNAAVLLPALEEHRTLELARALGYSRDPHDWE